MQRAIWADLLEEAIEENDFELCQFFVDQGGWALFWQICQIIRNIDQVI